MDALSVTFCKSVDDIKKKTGVNTWKGESKYRPSYNVTPTKYQPAIVHTQNAMSIISMKWGLSSAAKRHRANDSNFHTYAKDTVVNCRNDSVIEGKPMFSRLREHNRCVIIAEGFYEWRQDILKTPYYICLPDSELLYIAALYDKWETGEGGIFYTYAIITTPVNEKLSFIHDRMPAILRKDEINAWIMNDTYPFLTASELLRPYDDIVACHPVSALVGDVKNDSPQLIKKKEDLKITSFFQRSPTKFKEDSSPAIKRESSENEESNSMKKIKYEQT